MRKHLIPFIIMLLFSACASAEAEAIPTEAPTGIAAPRQFTDTPEPTVTATLPAPTHTSEPTPTASITPTPEPEVKSEYIDIPYGDKIIRGTLVGKGEIAVVLAPMFGESRGSWMKFARHIALLGYTALAFDFPGVGSSSGSFSFDGTTDDTVAVIEFLRERGYERIVCMGGSLGGGACFNAATMNPYLAGLVIISSPFNTTAEEVAELLMPKLMVLGDEPDDVKKPMRETYNLLPEPKQFEIIYQKGHGTELLTIGNELRDLLVDFLETIR